MNAATEGSARRPIDRWFASYSGDHRNPVNQAIHVVAVPLILWSVIALLWCIPPGALFEQGIWAVMAMFAAWLFYYRASRRIGLGMLLVFLAMAALTWWLHGNLGTRGLLGLAIGVFVVAWIAQFVGHSKLYENKKPSFFTDLRYLLIGPAWVLAKLYRRLGWHW
ncbi:Mpo1-like protein [Luteimonas sp. MJ293]|uniref:Mpo1 family 2-hydroxy fatty acid dioxygenase n=1 Tax=Luteimonas sp. MJ146 TaxID=3129240 RepID=UPI0031BAD7B1